jgi:hypothetical protein
MTRLENAINDGCGRVFVSQGLSGADMSLRHGPIEPTGELVGATGAYSPVVMFDPVDGLAALDRISLYENFRMILQVARVPRRE